MTLVTGRALLISVIIVAVAACGQSSPPVLATEHFSDPLADSTADLVGITTRATADSVTFDLEFATEELRDQSTIVVFIGSIPGDGSPICGGYYSSYFVYVPPMTPIPTGESHEGDLVAQPNEHVAWLEVVRDGPTLSVEVPLASIGDPATLDFRALAQTIGDIPSSDTEQSPDALDACHTASLGT